MQISVRLDAPSEAERLRTAAYRFAEMGRRLEAPAVRVRQHEGGLVSDIVFSSPDAAAGFEAYWQVFRTEQRSWSGFRDV